ncbi:DUF5753 domain-containing protein [Nonomuraea salmonea]|uniref:DUF5753 domain-containing protein n=1 Tax=Nonomuraea salmonea TaxID=46181 RepID=A0ABV5NNE2_9ACTN
MSHGIVDYGWLEARAERITSFDALVIPGLLQTEAYMEAVIRAEDPDATDEQVSRWIDFRRPRQQILPDSPHFSTVLDAYVLRRPIGTPATMHDQLTHLADRAPTIDLRVIPLDAGAHASPDGSFRIFQLPPPFPPVAYVPTPAGAIYVEGEEADRLKLKYDRLRRDTLSPDDSLELIATVAKSSPTRRTEPLPCPPQRSPGTSAPSARTAVATASRPAPSRTAPAE